MRKAVLALALALSLLLCAALCEEDRTEQFRLKYEESVAFKAVRTMARYLSDDLSLDESVMSFQKNSTAWDYMKYFDDGWFSSVKSRTYTNYRSENWEVLSDTEFSCDVYVDLTINFKTNNKVMLFPCGYHFQFKQTIADRDFWQAVDFSALPCESDIVLTAELSEKYEGLTFYAVNGKTFNGYMMVVDDPSRVYVGTIPYFGSSAEGKRMNKLVEGFDAIAAINGGGFADTGGSGNGGIPYGLVVAQGVVKRGHEPQSDIANVIIGFDENDKLIVGKYTYNEVNAMGLRDAMAFHPALVLDGSTAEHSERRMYTIRTAMGQDAEGRVLMLVVKGRQPDSLGASIEDLQQVMLDFGAVNAGNLDGGSSTCMFVDGDSLYSGYWPDYSRRLPSAFMVKAK